MAYVQEALGRRDIVNVYDGSGTINAADSYTVKSLVTGTVLTADFELGDTIQKGDVHHRQHRHGHDRRDAALFVGPDKMEHLIFPAGVLLRRGVLCLFVET